MRQFVLCQMNFYGTAISLKTVNIDRDHLRFITPSMKLVDRKRNQSWATKN